MKLHLGCGSDVKPGWINIDSAPPATLIHDLSRGLPYPSASVDYIYAQHFLEHLSREQGVQILKECYRVIVPSGIVRISVPDLREFVRLYLAGDLKVWGEIWQPKTPCQMMNEEFRWWGHQFIYDEQELTLVFEEAGFIKVGRRDWGRSFWRDLDAVETRPKHWNDLIMEATK